MLLWKYSYIPLSSTEMPVAISPLGLPAFLPACIPCHVCLLQISPLLGRVNRIKFWILALSKTDTNKPEMESSLEGRVIVALCPITHGFSWVPFDRDAV